MRGQRPFPWWLAVLVAGTVLAGTAAVLAARQVAGGSLAFLAAAVCIVAGLVGLLQHYRSEQTEPEEEEAPRPRINRRASCRIEQPLVDRLARAVKTLAQRAEEAHWSPDWPIYRRHFDEAEQLLAKKDYPAAFREYCRAIPPLTEALGKHRQKEESFQPVWDKVKS